MFNDLNQKQKEAVEAKDGPLLIIAGAGSGKTKTLTTRLAYLISKKDISPKNILAITFTNKASDEMKNRISKILSKKSNKDKLDYPFVGTFHSFGARVLRENSRFFGREINFSIFDRNDSLKLIREIIRLNEETKNITKGKSASILKEISRIKSELIGKNSFVNSQRSEKIWEIYSRYEKRLKENNAFDFDDLIEKAVRLFLEKKDILKRYQNKYKYVLIDEYQDVNTAQYKLVRLLAEKHKNINVVGDDQQSIYKFRFSDFRNFLNFDKDWPDAKVIALEQNYRSTKNIIEAASKLISKNEFQKHKELWTKNKTGKPIYIVAHENELDQADFIADKIIELKRKNVGILFRTNAQSRALEQVLIDRGIEYNLWGTVAFYERKEIKDIIAMLKIAFNPKDSASVARIEKVFYKRKTKELLEKLKNQNFSSPSDLINWVLKNTKYLSYLERNFINYEERFENIAELVYFANQFNDLGSFIENVSLSSPLDWRTRKNKRNKNNMSGINLMTIHLAKGLEFDAVIIAGANEGILPHKRSYHSQDDLEEERRLMYVAMTRAKELLFINYYDMPSRFLSEVPGNLIEYQTSSSDSFNTGGIIEYD